MTDIKQLEDRVGVLRVRVGQLKQTERIMLEARGLQTQIAKAKKETPKIDTDIQALKEELQDLTGQQEAIINQSLAAFTGRMEEALPEGTPSIKISGDKVEIGWMLGGTVRPFKALSGGERVSFDIALAHAFGANLIIKEVAELDHLRLDMALKKLKDIAEQVVLVTCHPPQKVPKEWSVCKL